MVLKLKEHCDQATMEVLETRRGSEVVLAREEKKLKTLHNKYVKEGKSLEHIAFDAESVPQVALLQTA